ncbi:MAG: HAD-IA family hydrolase [Pseudomonadota bacterium]
MKRYKLLVFDWDGTLMDSAAAIVASLKAASRDVGLPEPDDARARHVIGLGLAEAMAVLQPGIDARGADALVERYRRHYLACDHEIALFPGAAETVRELHARGHMLGVATGKSRRGLQRVLEATGLGPYFHATRCADECFSKPHPAMLEELMDELGADREETLMIGDTTHDLQMANNARVAGLGAAYGAHPKAGLLECRPLACIDTFAEMHSWLMQNA